MNTFPIAIGHVSASTVKVRVCLVCGGEIDRAGLCSPGCEDDGDRNRKPDRAEILTYERTDKLVKKEPYHR